MLPACSVPGKCADRLNLLCHRHDTRMLLRAALFRLAAGQGRKPGPCGLRPVPCLHFSPTAA
ncbi:hypothetical protein CDN97_22235 [Pantoea sp. AMG 501]|nr:hypothetical protein CDN97_22235 [Pantoea sp. AMG 501]